MNTTRTRKLIDFSHSTTRQLNTYALAASAAGVGVLALTQPAEAEVVFTPVHHVIHANQTYSFDLNNDGTADFELKNVYNTFSGNVAGYLQVLPLASANEVLTGTHARGCGGGGQCAAALPKGAEIGPKGAFQPDFPRGELMGASDIVSTNSGSWINVTRYLGLKFVIAGQTHYGWARVTVKDQHWTVTATLTGYAYETTPDTPITAGATTGSDDAGFSASASRPDSEATTLSALALGAPGLSIWRRE
jgi:hypothetical protein